jgi:hypothetical protein
MMHFLWDEYSEAKERNGKQGDEEEQISRWGQKSERRRDDGAAEEEAMERA